MAKPKGRPHGSRNIPWETLIAKLREQPDEWLLFPEMSAVPFRTVATIRRRERPALRLPDGVIRCRQKAIVELDGFVYVTLFLSFHPKEAT